VVNPIVAPKSRVPNGEGSVHYSIRPLWKLWRNLRRGHIFAVVWVSKSWKASASWGFACWPSDQGSASRPGWMLRTQTPLIGTPSGPFCLIPGSAPTVYQVGTYEPSNREYCTRHQNKSFFLQADQKKCVQSMEAVPSCHPWCWEDEETFWGHAECCHCPRARFLGVFISKLFTGLSRL